MLNVITLYVIVAYVFSMCIVVSLHLTKNESIRCKEVENSLPIKGAFFRFFADIYSIKIKYLLAFSGILVIIVF